MNNKIASLYDLVVGLPDDELTFRSFVLRDVNLMGGSKKRRVIYAPSEPMKKLHERLIDLLRSCGPFMRYAHGGVPGRSSLTNVQEHVKLGHRYYYCTDLVSAYVSVRVGQMVKVLCHVFPRLNDGNTRDFLAKYCFSWDEWGEPKGLLTGAPASPDLFNLLLHFSLDMPIAKLCRTWLPMEVTYTRYLDDLTFSSDQPIGKRMRKRIRELIERAGFSVNHRKSTVTDLATTSSNMKITGIGIRLELDRSFGGDLPKVYVPHHYVEHVRGMAHLVKHGRGGEELRERHRGSCGPIIQIMKHREGCFFGARMADYRIMRSCLIDLEH